MASSITIFILMILNNPPTTVHANPIKNIVVLIMENRSFDHMLGWMKRINPEINGVDGSEVNQLSVTDTNSKRFYFNNQSHYLDPDPGHSFQAIREQIFGSDNDTSGNPPSMNGFAQQAYDMDNTTSMSQSVINGFDPDMVVFYKTLISEFAVFDRWFASVPSSTQPNRLYVHSATSNGATNYIPALLIRATHKELHLIISMMPEYPSEYTTRIFRPLFYRNLRKLKYITKFHEYDLSFKQHSNEGKLPGYVVVEQRYMDTKVYETLRASPRWNETLFVITYDEHGGFFDHVPTPVSGVPSTNGIVRPDPFLFKFDRLGVRVPTIAVSPWIEKGTVVHGPNESPFPTSEYEHSSIPATVKKLYDLSSFLTKRGEWAVTFEGIVEKKTQPRTDCPELMQLAAVLKDHILTSFPDKIRNEMNVKQGKEYMEDAVRRFFEAGQYAKKMGVSEEHIILN
ncbi:Non-specific phospholipase [Quillaja saponaria]|uniref:Non-specific phospholipase n=1 Tax=Quillaja saponaria TaxID=32244 RepID=A0AAD7LVG1_QUISA|nr:Non-specific phospholipase [Quillaja saponaria]